MKTFTLTAPRLRWSLLLKIIICTLWLLCIVSAAFARDKRLPALGQQPVAQTACSGSNPTFTIGNVSGTTGTVTIRWQVSVSGLNGTYTNITDGTVYGGTATNTLTVLNVSTGLNGNYYRCVVTDASGTTTTNGAVLNVNAKPAVSAVTRLTTICEAASAGLQITNDPSLDYQWQLSDDNGISWQNAANGETNDITYPAATMAMNGYLYRYIAKVKTTSCADTSRALDTLRVIAKPAFTGGNNITPLASTICPGANTSFTANATGTFAIGYQWQYVPLTNPVSNNFINFTDDASFSGTQSNTLQVTNFTGIIPGINQYQVRLKAEYPSLLGCASVTNAGVLTVRVLPSVTVQPVDTAVCAGSNAGFKVSAAGTATLNYLWQTDNGTAGATWTNIGANPLPTAATLNLGVVGVDKNGYRYRVNISSGTCIPATTSAERVLTVRRSGTWLGTKDIKWEEPLNWCGGVPTSTTDVLVPEFWPPNMPTISDGTGTAFFQSIIIENAAKLTISGGTVNNMTGPYSLLGTVAYTAMRDQYIFPANHGSLEINGSDNKFLSSSVDVSRNLVLGGTAKLVTRANVITMKTGSNTITAAPFTSTATSWIVTGNGNAGAVNTGLGGLRIEQVDAADGAVLYPIGPTPTAYNPIQLTNAGTVDHFTIAVNDQMIPGGIYASGVSRTWLVSEAVNGGSNVMLSLKWGGSEEQTDFDRDLTSIIRSNGTQIVEMSGQAPANGSNPYARADGAFNILTQFSVSSSSVVLPIQLKAFTAQKTVNATVGLSWNTAGASTPRSFDVQRSNDGVHFISIGKVNGQAGNGVYNYTDNLPGTGTVYYRLMVTGEHNEILYSGIQSVVLNSANLLQLRPSATAGAVTNIYVHASKQAKASLFITDIAGRIYHRQSLLLNKGEQQIPLWIGNLGKGVYYVHVKDEQGNVNVLTLLKW